MRVLVTGGAGFIGSHLAEALVADGHQVVVFDDLSSGSRSNVPEGAKFVSGDIRNNTDLEELFERFTFDAISHQAAQTSVSVSTREPLRDADINILGSLQLLRYAMAAKVPRFVFASTGGAIYGEVREGRRAKVGDPTTPLSPYACSKLAFESYLGAARQSDGYASTVLRYANVYGERQDPHGEAGVVAIFCQRLLQGQQLQINAMEQQGDPGCIRDYIHVKDVVTANRAALEGQLDAPVVNVGTGTPATTSDLAMRLSELAGSSTDFQYADRREGDLMRSVLDPSPIPGLQDPVPLNEGLERTWRWFEAQSR